MAGPGSNKNGNQQFNSQLFLSPNQQDLLMAALNSNNPSGQALVNGGQSFKQGTGDMDQQFGLGGLDATYYTNSNAIQDFGAVNFDNLDDSPFVDFLDGDTSFDFDANNGDMMIGSLPGHTTGDSPTDNDSPEKRKSPEDDDDEDIEGGHKRREGEDKTAKKPGRKPLTSEPTTKRKAQNRAAQRAFRERKEKHLKDLETKVAELEKASDAANHENGLLRAQVSRLQTELREYRKRLSSNASGANRSPTNNPYASFLNGVNGGSNNFQFEFPKFGGLPGAHMLSNGPLVKSATVPSPNGSVRPGVNMASNVLSRHNSAGSPNSHGVNSPPEQTTSRQNSLANGNAASPAVLGGLTTSSPFEVGNSPQINGNRGRTDSSSTHSRIFQFNSGSNASTTNSPSASSVSQYGGANSSCGTSPEPSHNSPTTSKADEVLKQGYVCHGNSEGEITFCEKLNMACGNPRNPVPRAMSNSNGKPANPATKTAADSDTSGIDFLANQNGGQFDPTLFGDYREPQANIIGDGDFTGGFFDDAFNFNAYSSPFNLDVANAPTSTSANGSLASKPSPLELIEKIQDGVEEEVVPADDTAQLLNCHKIWDKLAQRPDFKDGTIDIDNLCTELRAKARCSESGVVVDNKDVEAALKRIPEANRS